jgi:choline dehydrogenase-like flavoprotein
MTEHADVVVIGSGAGGGAVTWALASTGKKILLLERGDWLPRELENWSSQALWADKRYHNSGQWTDAAAGRRFSPKQHYYVGGNTKFYGAILYRFREYDFGAVQHVDGVSPAWPISYADLASYYDWAEQLYQVHGTRGEDPDEPPASGRTRGRRSATSRVSPSCAPTWPLPGCTPSRCPTGSCSTRRARTCRRASAARPATVTRAWSTARRTPRS